MMIVCRPPRPLLVPSILVLVLATCPTALAQRGNKPPKNDPPAAELPAIRYSITVVPIPSSGTLQSWGTGRISNLGMAVGAYRDAADDYSPYLFDVTTGSFIDFRTETALTDQLQILAPGYRFHRAFSINDMGVVVGSIYSDQDDVQSGFAVDTALSTDVNDWEVKLLPDVGGYRSYGFDINLWGDILGVFHVPPNYQGRDLFVCNPFSDPPRGATLLGDGSAWPAPHGNINDAGLMTRYFYTTGPIEVYDVSGEAPSLIRTITTGRIGDHVSMNNSGIVAAFKVNQVLGQKKRGKSGDLAVQIDSATGNTENLVQSGSFTLFGKGSHFLNSTGDAAFQNEGNSTGRIELLHRGFSPDHATNVWNVDDLIADDDPWKSDWIASWGGGLGISAITDRSDQNDATGYPVLYGTFFTSNGVTKAAVLTPHDLP